jgi:predicted HicB family RNase H-like nuclease
MSTLTYKTFEAHVDIDWADLCYVGHVLNADDITDFLGATVEEAEQDFHEVVDAYLAACEDLELEPEEDA